MTLDLGPDWCSAGNRRSPCSLRGWRPGQSAQKDLLSLQEWRGRLQSAIRERLDGFDAFACPTVPIPPPALDALDDGAAYSRNDALLLRNSAVSNLLDGCAISIPMQFGDELPSGFMLTCLGGEDENLLHIAEWGRNDANRRRSRNRR